MEVLEGRIRGNFKPKAGSQKDPIPQKVQIGVDEALFGHCFGDGGGLEGGILQADD